MFCSSIVGCLINFRVAFVQIVLGEGRDAAELALASGQFE
jgi:hypothetical protein